LRKLIQVRRGEEDKEGRGECSDADRKMKRGELIHLIA
jgi:hypothetical protein